MRIYDIASKKEKEKEIKKYFDIYYRHTFDLKKKNIEFRTFFGDNSFAFNFSKICPATKL